MNKVPSGGRNGSANDYGGSGRVRDGSDSANDTVFCRAGHASGIRFAPWGSASCETPGRRKAGFGYRGFMAVIKFLTRMNADTR
jgi:hypothetical protein